MITEDYVSFEVAKLLKGKGFDEECWSWYEDEDYVIESNDDYGYQSNTDHVSYDFICSRPTIQMVLKWLREVHNICIETLIVFPTGKNGEPFFSCNYWSLKSPFDLNVDYEIESRYFKTYEEAQEEAIKYCLENLL